jgi:hypothetical protein
MEETEGKRTPAKHVPSQFRLHQFAKTLWNLLWQSSGINASIPNKGPCGTSSFAPKDPKTDLEGLSDLALGKNKDMHFQLACYP